MTNTTSDSKPISRNKYPIGITDKQIDDSHILNFFMFPVALLATLRGFAKGSKIIASIIRLFQKISAQRE